MMKIYMKCQIIFTLLIGILVISVFPNLFEFKNGVENFTKEYMISEMTIEDKPVPRYFDINKTLGVLPKEIIEMMYTDGVKIETTTELGEKSQYGRITSKYIHKNKKIILQHLYSNEIVLLHEIGHAYSYNKMPIIKISDTLKFKKIYNEEKDIIFPDGGKFLYKNFNVKYDYVKVNSEEYFAQCFAMYFTGLLTKDSETFKYLDKLLGICIY